MERDGNPLAALLDESRALSAVLRQADPADFSRPTNCPPWNLKELVVHIAMSISLLGAEPPAGLGWDDRTLLAAGTGRRALTSGERTLLVSLQDRFPLLS